MKKYIQYVEQFHENKKNEIDFINNQLAKHLVDNEENQTEIEHILDFLYATDKSYSTIGYSTIAKKAEAWNKKLQTLSAKDNEVEGVDYIIELDFYNGYKFVKLLSQEAYNREGKIMSHCVSSYFGRDDIIYSLRDDRNKPHCTISSDSGQVKGKGNGSIDPEYVDMVVKFLEHLGMSVGENEMKNLGYIKLNNIDAGLSCEGNYNGYITDKHLSTIVDKNGDIYNGFGLLKIKKYVEVKGDFSLKFNFDLSTLVGYVVDFCSKLLSNNKSHSTAVANDSYSTAVARGHSSTAVANDSYSTAVANDSSSTAVANEISSTAVANDSYSTAVANESYSTAVANESHSTAVANDSSSTAVARGHSSTAVANDSSSTAVARGENSIALCRGADSKAMGNIGAWIIIAEYDEKKENIIHVISKKVDGVKIKENTYYCAKGGNLIEWEEQHFTNKNTNE